jgi:hypothetical protein
MEDTDWRPSSCPECGKLREAARYPVCENKNCRDFGRGGIDKNQKERTMINKEPKRYLWVRKDWTMSIIEDPVALLDPTQYSNFDKENDHIYEIGPEVEVKVSVEVKNKKPVYRENASGYRTSFENRD